LLPQRCSDLRLSHRMAQSRDPLPPMTSGGLRGWGVHIEPGVTKGGEGRMLFQQGELQAAIEKQWQEHRLDCPFACHRAGRPMKNFRWKRTLEVSGPEENSSMICHGPPSKICSGLTFPSASLRRFQATTPGTSLSATTALGESAFKETT
jgi:hypothetical protein